MKLIRKTFFLLVLCGTPILTAAQNSAPEIPDEVKVFVEKGSRAITLETADLNGDGTRDFILVTEKTKVQTDKNQTNNEDNEDARSLVILTREAGGKLTLAKQNGKVVYCKSCGGAFGDPFAGVEAKRGSFTVSNYGGSASRWSESYQFNYSRRDRTWQLVRVEQERFNALEPEKVKTVILTPKNFGKIDIADFDPSAIGKSK